MSTGSRQGFVDGLGAVLSEGGLALVVPSIDDAIAELGLDPEALAVDEQWELLQGLHGDLTGAGLADRVVDQEPLATFLMWTLSPSWEESHFETPEHLLERAESGGYPDGTAELLEAGTLLDVVGDDEDMLIVACDEGYALVGTETIVQLTSVDDLLGLLAALPA